MYRNLIILEIKLITDIRKVISNSDVFKIQINIRLFVIPSQLWYYEPAHTVNLFFFFHF